VPATLANAQVYFLGFHDRLVQLPDHAQVLLGRQHRSRASDDDAWDRSKLGGAPSFQEACYSFRGHRARARATPARFTSGQQKQQREGQLRPLNERGEQDSEAGLPVAFLFEANMVRGRLAQVKLKKLKSPDFPASRTADGRGRVRARRSESRCKRSSEVVASPDGFAAAAPDGVHPEPIG
jgi:hypothetical protein